MSQFDNCVNCFLPLGNAKVCPNCGYEQTAANKYNNVLPAFTVLNNRYLIGRVLGKGGFGVTYIAQDMVSGRICAIKEYMPSEYSTRPGGTLSVTPFNDEKSRYVFSHGREKFILEAKTLLKLRSNPIVVDILDYFNQNNTAYLVMEYLDGQDLRKMARAAGGKLDPDLVKNVFVMVASSLMEIHRMNILHRDLSPENIIVTSKGNVKLIDFGAARNFVSTQNKGMSILLKPGFAPPEQYNAKGAHGPWSDVYALCATFYNLVSGKPLVDALFRYRGEKQPSLISLGCNVSRKTSDVIEKGLELDYKKRYKSFKELLDDIDIGVSGVSKPSVKAEPIKSDIQSVPAVHSAKKVETSNKNTSGVVKSQNLHQPYIAAIVGNSYYNRIILSNKDIVKIGRSPQSCQCVISGDTNISRIHCYLRFDGTNIYITDVSANGTFLENGYRLVKNKEILIKPGTKFYLATSNHMMIVN